MSYPVPAAFREMALSLKELSGRQRTASRRQIQKLFGISDSTMSNWLRACGIVTNRDRCDKGISRLRLKDEQFALIFAIQYSSHKSQQGPIMPTRDALEIAEHNGIIEAGSISESSYNAWLHDRQAAKLQLESGKFGETVEPFVNLVSLGPNHVHQIDSSLAINWKVENNRPIYEELVYKNKLPAAGTPRIQRVMLIDHTSGAFYVHYEIATGEDFTLYSNALFYGWSEKFLNGRSIRNLYPFEGVPRILMLDRASANQSQAMKNLMTRLGVQLNICAGARSKGAVESIHWWWEQRFESRFRIHPPSSIDEIQAHATEFAAKICSRETHTRHRSTRFHHWQHYIKSNWESDLRILPRNYELWKMLATTDPKRCRVEGDGTIQFKTKRYRLPEQLIVARVSHVLTEYSPYEYPAVLVRDAADPAGPQYLRQPLEFDQHGFPVDGVVIGSKYERHRRTARGSMVKAAAVQVNELVAARQIEAFGYHMQDAVDTGIRRTGAELDLSTPARGGLTVPEARQQVLKGMQRPLTAPEWSYVNDYLARFETLSTDQVEYLIDALQREQVSASVIAMKPRAIAASS